MVLVVAAPVVVGKTAAAARVEVVRSEVAAMLTPLMGQPVRDAPTLALTGTELHIGDRLTVDVRAPGFDGYLYIDYFNSDGEVLHLFPSEIGRAHV